MSYTPSYNRPAQGNFNPDKAFSQVRAGTDAYLLEDEANELQAILSEQNRDDLRRLLNSGVVQAFTAGVDSGRTNVVRIPMFEAVVDGLRVKVAGTNTTNTTRVAGDNDLNLVQLSAKPATGTRTDLVILEVYKEDVIGSQKLYKYGTQNSDYTLTNDLVDTRIGAETSRRVQVKNVIRVLEGLTGGDLGSDLVGSAFTETETGLLKSNSGHVAIRLCSVTRTSGETGLATPLPLFSLARVRTTDLIADSSLLTSMIKDANVTTTKIADQNVTTAKIADSNVTTAKIADANVTSAKLMDSSVLTQKLADSSVSNIKLGSLAVTTAKIADLNITTAKIADQNVTFAKLALDVINGLGASVPSDTVNDNGFTPVLRFFNWWSLPAAYVQPDTFSPRYASAWGNDMVQKTGNAWRFMTGMEYMSQNQGKWFDKNVQLVTYTGSNFADNVSVICMQNTSVTSQIFQPNIFYSSYGGTNVNTSASVAYKILDPSTKPTLAADFVSFWEVSTSTSGTNNFTISVPAGQVIIFILKTSPQLMTSTSYANYSYNYHGFFGINTPSYFKPHVGTYRRLLSGKWD